MSVSRRKVLLGISAFPSLWLAGCGSGSPSNAVKAFTTAMVEGDADAARKVTAESFLERQGRNFSFLIAANSATFKAFGGASEVEILGTNTLSADKALVEVAVHLKNDKAMIFKCNVIRDPSDGWKVASWASMTEYRK